MNHTEDWPGHEPLPTWITEWSRYRDHTERTWIQLTAETSAGRYVIRDAIPDYTLHRYGEDAWRSQCDSLVQQFTNELEIIGAILRHPSPDTQHESQPNP